MLDGLDLVQRDNRVRDYVLPKRVVAYSNKVTGVESLLTKKHTQIALEETDLITVEGQGYVVLDFGKEIHGGVRIITHSVNGNANVRIRFGESVSEAYGNIANGIGSDSATNDHSPRDFLVQLVGLSDNRFGETGFRFVRIDFLSDATVTIKSILGVFEHRDLVRKGKFECSDQTINKIFDVGAYTVELCMQSQLWDGIKRDRLVWIGDTHPEMLTILSIFGNDECIENALRFSAQKAPLPAFINTIPAYSLWWLCIISDYYKHNNNLDFVVEHKNYILGLVNMIDERVTKDGNLVFSQPYMAYFLDWQSANYDQREAGVYALCSLALQKLQPVINALGISYSKCENILNRLNKNLDGGNLMQVNALKLLGKHANAQEILPKQLSRGADGMSTFMSYYILASIAECGEAEKALQIMKEYYGAMLSRGATSFWEDFNMQWLEGSGTIDELPKSGQKDLHADYGDFCYKGLRHSLCHGWSSGVVPFLMQYVLGIKDEGVGCKQISISPNLCGLKWAKGQYPTPYGIVSVEIAEQNGKCVTTVNCPKEIEIINRK